MQPGALGEKIGQQLKRYPTEPKDFITLESPDARSQGVRACGVAPDFGKCLQGRPKRVDVKNTGKAK